MGYINTTHLEMKIFTQDFDGYRIFSFLSKVAEEHNSAIKVNSKYGVQQWNKILAEVSRLYRRIIFVDIWFP